MRVANLINFSCTSLRFDLYFDLLVDYVDYIDFDIDYYVDF